MTAPLRLLQASLLAPVKPRELGGLFSFHYFKDADLGTFLDRLEANGYQPEVFTDSGGFSAFSQGVIVDLDSYARWLVRWKSRLHHYANLDVIGDPRASLRNQILLERKGLRPLPVLHVGSDPEEIRTYRARGYEMMCLGGMVPLLPVVASSLRGDQIHPAVDWLSKCHEVAKEEGVILHGFGATNIAVMRAWPWVSVDSSSWATGFRFGRVTVFDPLRKTIARLACRDTQTLLSYASVLRFYGVDPMDLIRDGDKTRIALVTLAGRSHLAMARWLRSLPGTLPGFQLYLADSAAFGTDARALALVLSTQPPPM